MRIIGVDVGHCEMAAATPNDQGGKFIGISNLYLNENKDFVVPAEIRYPSNESGELFNYFKASPKHFDEKIYGNEVEVSRRELMTRLLRELIFEIKERNDYLKNDQILLLVGCPTSKEWTDEKNRKEYEKLIKEATGVAKVRVIPESRAAMFSSLADGKGRMISAYGGAVVYDFGSSTADCTYMRTGEKCVEMSWNFGAREIEKNLNKMMHQEAENTAMQKGLELVRQNNSAMLERMLRGTKEAYFSDELDEDAAVVAYKFPTNQKKLTVTLDIDDSVIDEALDMEMALEVNSELISGGWKSCCKEFFYRSKDYIEKNGCSVKEIVLTGGASKMGFVADYAREVFPKESYNVTCAANPSFSVSHGLVWVGLVDEFEEECISIVKKNVINSGVGNVWRLKESLKKSIGDKIYEAIITAMEGWAESDKDESLNELQDRMNRAVANRISTLKYLNRTCVLNWSNDIIKEIRSQLETEIQKKFGNALGQKMRLPESKWNQVIQKLEGVNIDMEKIISDIDVNGILRNLIMLAIVLAYVAAASIIIPIPVVSQLIGLGIGAFTASVIDNNDRNKKHKQRIRNNAMKSMKEDKQKDKIFEMCSAEIDKVIDKQISDDSVAIDIEAIAARAYEIMTLKFDI